MTAAQKNTQSTMPAPANDHDDEITIERRVDSTRKTTRMSKVDSRLLAIARGELDPDDPFGGLIPIYENDEEAGIFGDTVPSVRMRPHEIMALPIEPRSAFFLTQIDGRRTVGELVGVCKIDDLAGLEIIDELLRFGAIELR